MIVTEKEIEQHLRCMSDYKTTLEEHFGRFYAAKRCCDFKLNDIKHKTKRALKQIPKIQEGIEKQEENNIDFELEFENDLRTEERRIFKKLESYLCQAEELEEKREKSQKIVDVATKLHEALVACSELPRNSDKDESFLTASFQLRYKIECFLNGLQEEIGESDNSSDTSSNTSSDDARANYRVNNESDSSTLSSSDEDSDDEYYEDYDEDYEEEEEEEVEWLGEIPDNLSELSESSMDRYYREMLDRILLEDYDSESEENSTTNE